VSHYVLHIDFDEFIAAVEVLRRPELRGRPVVVGGAGDPTRRGVVATASYEARRFGIGSGTPLRTALRRCPEAVFLPMDRPAYEEASARAMIVLAEAPGVLEVAGWDEAFLATKHEHPEEIGSALQRDLLERTGLNCSVGIGDNKLQAKLASSFAKPAGISRLGSDTWDEVMGTRPTDALWGVGRKRARRLAAMGITTVGELAEVPDATLAATFGPTTGPWLRRVARGEDHSTVVSARRLPRSRGREKTFDQNIAERGAVRTEVSMLARDVASDLRDQGLEATRVIVKIRYAPFLTRTRGVALDRAAAEQAIIEHAAEAAFDALYEPGSVRLVGVRCELKRVEPPPRID
jgi:DNA polymerase-4